MQKFDTAPGRNGSMNAAPSRPAAPAPAARPSHECTPGSKVKAPAGFTGGVISGKV